MIGQPTIILANMSRIQIISNAEENPVQPAWD